MAREPRTIRRILAVKIHEVLQRSLTSRSPCEARVMPPAWPGSPHYVFLVARPPAGLSAEEYREKRVQLLSDYCNVAKLRFPDATHIVGIATEDANAVGRSEDMVYIDASKWDADAFNSAREIQQRLGILKNVKTERETTHEYPVDHAGKPRPTTLSRNSKCRCGSGKRFKRCHGKDVNLRRYRN